MKPAHKAVCALALFALFTAVPVAAQQTALARPAPATSAAVGLAEKLKLEGLPNLGKVSERIYRGGQPDEDADAYRKLKELGIEIVVNLREGEDDITQEKQIVEALGMRFVSIPWSGYARPNNRQVAEFLELLRAHPDKKVFVHCRRGAERTGVMVAAYRMTADGWTAQQALDEMEAFKFRGFWFRHLKKYVREFTEKFAADPAFTSLRPAAASSSPQ